MLAPSQKLIPFLGAGASLAGAAPGTSRPVTQPTAETIDTIASQLGLTGLAKDHLRQSILQACEMQAYSTEPAAAIREVRDKSAPPSARELAAALAASSGYAGSWPFSLLAVSSYHEFVFQRAGHFSALQQLFAAKQAPLPTHELIAEAARHHLRNSKRDYLVITTNYDRLIEIAFDKAGVHYCVLTVDRNDRIVDVCFSSKVREWLDYGESEYRDFEEEHRSRYPQFFNLSNRPKPLAVLYKIHGCLQPAQSGRDSIVLSDEDYITFLRRQGEGGEGIMPAAVKPLIQNKGFLFLGYSFSDWNIRGLYKMIVGQRAPGRALQDYTVVSSLSPYESAYFSQQSIHILVADLVDFVSSVRNNAPPNALAEAL